MLTVTLTPIYIDAINHIHERVRISQGGKRFWDNKGSWWKEESSYPDYVRFFFTNKGMTKDKDGTTFNGNRKELLYLLDKAKTGILPKSKRLHKAFDIILNGYKLDLEEIERLDNETFGTPENIF